ncbi:MAG: hypothetical protein H0X15_07170 [Acidobacteria bacterium]|jgi:hypothetical protein|nr:hypothetical protein [Acidobacteriota bacterium]MBA4122761.1 hypothetical protein [Acidobacteriota bacterium]
MKLAESSHRKLEAFFREYLNDETFRLPPIYFYVGKFTNLLTALISVHGITFGRRIFITSRLLSFNQNNLLKLPEDLAAHEIAHVLQYRREGFSKFFYKYLTSFWRNLQKRERWDAVSRQNAYLEIPFEVEARAVAAKFVEWNNLERRKDKS